MFVKAPNPDHVALCQDLVANPQTAMCPICGERGFWDNRTSKSNPKSPDFKCKNKACVGATPMKGKSPYAVWLPADFTDAPTPSGKRLTGPTDAPAASPRPVSIPGHDPSAPPATEPPDELWSGTDVPDAVDYGRPVEVPAPSAGIEARIAAYFLLARKVAAFQSELGKTHEMPFDAASVNAMSFSIWNSRGTA